MDPSIPSNLSPDILSSSSPDGPPNVPPRGEIELTGGSFRHGARALITGGSWGIGYAVAALCLAWSMKVFVVDDDQGMLDQAKANLKADKSLAGEATFLKADVGNREDWKKIQSITGVVDFLFLLQETDVESRATLSWKDGQSFDKVFHTNLNGVLYGLNAYVTTMEDVRENTAIVILGSQYGLIREPLSPAYTACKAAVTALAEQLTLEFHGKTTVHLLLPGQYRVGPRGNGPPFDGKHFPYAWEEWQVVDYMYKKMSEGQFYIICPDRGMTEEKLNRRLLWRAGDMLYRRGPMSLFNDKLNNESIPWLRHEHHIT